MISRADHEALAATSLEQKLSNPLLFGLTTASDMQRAVCRIADGRPLGELGKLASVRKAFGNIAHVEGKRPKEIAVVSGIRVAKSLMAAAAAFHGSQIIDLSRTNSWEVPRVSIVSVKKDLADVIYQHLSGGLLESKIMRETLLEQPTAGRVLVRHPSGRPVEIKVVAGSRAGASLVARWSAGCVFDEFARMYGGGEAIVNWDDSRDAVLLRMLPRAQIWHITSPKAAFGPCYKMVTSYWGKPTPQVVVVRAPAYEMNPVIWTPEAVAEAKKAKPEVYQTDIEAEFADQEESMFSAEDVSSAQQDWEHAEPEQGCTYTAAMDPAMRGNGWTLVVTTRKGKKKIVVLAKEWRGSNVDPLKSNVVMTEIAGELRPYGVTTIYTDRYCADALVDVGREAKLRVIPVRISDQEITEQYQAISVRFSNGEIELPKHEQLRVDLLRIQKRITNTGVHAHLPGTPDGRHCDYAPSFRLCMARYLSDKQDEVPSKMSAEEARVLAEMKKRYGRKEPGAGTPWG